ncbi:hypothetical protein PG984_005592 [Apiospora sp. TS-2023a]
MATAPPPPFARNSLPIPRHLYEGEEYFCLFAPRVHRDVHLTDAGSWQCQVDFLASGAEARADASRNKDVKAYAVGCINPIVGNFTALVACEARSDRLALTTYMIEYAYIHDDVIEYAEKKGESDLAEANEQLIEGITLGGSGNKGSKDDVKRRQLQAKMVMELMDVDKVQGKECLRLWREMSDVFVQIRDLKFKTLDEYLKYRAVDAGCPWMMSLLCFAMDLPLTADDKEKTLPITWAAYGAWVLVNDYFSWDKELLAHKASGGTGVIANAVFLYARWHSIGYEEARKMVREEIMAYEENYVRLKDEFLVANGGAVSDNILRWFNLMDMTTSGNFAWSMTTARYHSSVEDAYPALRRTCSPTDSGATSGASGSNGNKVNKGSNGISNSLGCSISANAAKLASQVDAVLAPRRYLDATTPEPSARAGPQVMTVMEPRPTVVERQRPDTAQQAPVPRHSSLHQHEELILQPQRYLETMPSKGVRNAIIDGLEVWYHVPEKSLVVIRDIINLLHSFSLMLDDIQDGSQLRRGLPAAHMVFGVGQTINASNLVFIKALQLAESLSPAAVRIVLERMLDGHIGQGLDLHWTHHTDVPTEEDYFTMVDGKTGTLFIMLAELMRSEATRQRDLDAGLLMKLVGRFFQARDDYQNLECDEYAEQKGFADDIAEGKMSLPLLHALGGEDPAAAPQRARLRSIMQQRKNAMGNGGQGLSYAVRRLAVADIRAAGGIDAARKTALHLQEAVDETLTMYESRVGEKNWLLRLAQKRLEIEEIL